MMMQEISALLERRNVRMIIATVVAAGAVVFVHISTTRDTPQLLDFYQARCALDAGELIPSSCVLRISGVTSKAASLPSVRELVTSDMDAALRYMRLESPIQAGVVLMRRHFEPPAVVDLPVVVTNLPQGVAPHRRVNLYSQAKNGASALLAERIEVISVQEKGTNRGLTIRVDESTALKIQRHSRLGVALHTDFPGAKRP